MNSCRCFTMIPAPSICARVYRYVPRLCLAPRWIALSLDHVDWGRLIIATFREAISIVTVEDLRDRDKLVRWLSRDNLVNQARHSHTFQSTHKYGCYLLIRTRFALLRSYQLYFLQFTLSPRFSIYTCVYIYTRIFLISLHFHISFDPSFILSSSFYIPCWPFCTGHQNDYTSEKSVAILRKYTRSTYIYYTIPFILLFFFSKR